MTEIWNDVKGYNGKYQVSSYGRVKNVWDDKMVAPVLTGDPAYFYVNLKEGKRGDGGKRKLVRLHRVVALSFLEQEEGLDFVDHIDRNPYNNNLYNLRWVDRKGNQRNLHNNLKIFVEGVERTAAEALEEYLGREYRTIEYSFVRSRLVGGQSLEDAIRDMKYHHITNYKTRALHRSTILTGASSKWGKWEMEEIWQGFKTQISVRGKNYRSLQHFSEDTNFSRDWCRGRLKEGVSYEEILDTPANYLHEYEYAGVVGTKEEICLKLGDSWSRVSALMYKHNISFEEALAIPRKREAYYEFFGVKEYRKFWLDLVGVEKRIADKYTGRFFQLMEDELGKDWLGVLEERLSQVDLEERAKVLTQTGFPQWRDLMDKHFLQGASIEESWKDQEVFRSWWEAQGKGTLYSFKDGEYHPDCSVRVSPKERVMLDRLRDNKNGIPTGVSVEKDNFILDLRSLGERRFSVKTLEEGMNLFKQKAISILRVNLRIVPFLGNFD